MMTKTTTTPEPLTHWSLKWQYDEAPEVPRRRVRWQGVCGQWTEEKHMSADPSCSTCKVAVDTWCRKVEKESL